MSARMGLLRWGRKVYNREEEPAYDPIQWRQQLQNARAAWCDHGADDEYDLGRGGPGFVAAVCVRDHWEDMTGEERDWCVDLVCSEIERQGDFWNSYARVQVFNMSADRPCAWVVPLLLGKSLSDARRTRVRQMLVVAFTHAIDEVRRYAVSGIGRNLWAIDRELALRCVNALATEATLGQQADDPESRRPRKKRRQHDEIRAEVALLVRQRFYEADFIANNAYQALDPTQRFGAAAIEGILTILGQAPTEPAAIATFDRLVHALVGWWDADDGGEQRRERNFEAESTLCKLLENFLLRTPIAAATMILQPILNAVDRHPREVRQLLEGLILAEDSQPNTAQFWSLWTLFADKVRRATWLAGIDREHASGNEMMSAIFLGPWWKEDARHWRSLEGHASRVHALFEDLPASSTVLDYYLRFLYRIGGQSLPEAFIRIAKRLQQGNPEQMMRKGNTVFMLEALLQRFVYGRPLELKRQSDLREAVLFLLDLLVEQGSSAAFRMRDDFVTPVSST
jgi:hypothetical protein